MMERGNRAEGERVERRDGGGNFKHHMEGRMLTLFKDVSSPRQEKNKKPKKNTHAHKKNLHPGHSSHSNQIFM